MKFGYTINNKLMMNSNGKLLGVEVNDPYNPLHLPQGTIRVRTNDGQQPLNGNYDTATLVEGTTDVYDVPILCKGTADSRSNTDGGGNCMRREI